jgi:hypothetical protein
VLSVPEQRLVVLRNGKIIGKSRVRIPAERLAGTHALEFAGFDQAGRSTWIYLDVPGGERRAGQAFDMAALQGVQAPPAYVEYVRSVLKPGVTLVVTDGGILSGGAGKAMTVIDG